MGWCSGTEIFDELVEPILEENFDDESKCLQIARIVNALEKQDWDCQSDSDYYDHPLVKSVFKEIHPDWFDDDIDDLKQQIEQLKKERNVLARMAYVFIIDNGIDYEYEFIQRYENGYYLD